MPVLRDAPVIGLTGSFASGCSSLMEVLQTTTFEFHEKMFTFKGFSLSDFVKEQWLLRNWEQFGVKGKCLEDATGEEKKSSIKER